MGVFTCFVLLCLLVVTNGENCDCCKKAPSKECCDPKLFSFLQFIPGSCTNLNPPCPDPANPCRKYEEPINWDKEIQDMFTDPNNPSAMDYDCTSCCTHRPVCTANENCANSALGPCCGPVPNPNTPPNTPGPEKMCEVVCKNHCYLIMVGQFDTCECMPGV